MQTKEQIKAENELTDKLASSIIVKEDMPQTLENLKTSLIFTIEGFRHLGCSDMIVAHYVSLILKDVYGPCTCPNCRPEMYNPNGKVPKC